jgi:uncharacterized OB-fold protein
MCSTAPVTSGESTCSLELPYRRSVGPVVGSFLTGLRDQQVLGSRTSGGRVVVPPLEYDPDTGDALDELVEGGSAGVVTSWAWVDEPLRKHPLDRPFGWVMVQLDGADTSLVHALEAAMQVRGIAGEHQVADGHTAVGPRLRRGRPVLRHVSSPGHEAVTATEATPEREAMRIDSEIGMDVFKSDDAKEGPRAFMDKRTPQFEGR